MSKRQASRQLARSDVEGEEEATKSPGSDDRRVKARKTEGATTAQEPTGNSFLSANSGGSSIFGGLSEANSTKEASGGLFAGLNTLPTSSGNGFAFNSNGFALNPENPREPKQLRFLDSTLAQQSPKLTPDKEASDDLPAKASKASISDKGMFVFKRSKTPEFGAATEKAAAKSIFANVGLKGDTKAGSTNLFGNYGSPPQKGTNAFALAADTGGAGNLFALPKAATGKTDDLTVPPSALQTPSLYAHQQKSPSPNLDKKDRNSDEEEAEEPETVTDPTKFHGSDQQTTLFQFDKADLKKLSKVEAAAAANSPDGAPAFGKNSGLGAKKDEKKSSSQGEAEPASQEAAQMSWSVPISGLAQLNKDKDTGVICIHFFMKATQKLLLNTPLWVCKDFEPKGNKTVEFFAYDTEQKRFQRTQLKLGDPVTRDLFLKHVKELQPEQIKMQKSKSPSKS